MGAATRKPTVTRQQVDARPQRRRLEAVAVQRKPDALQPDDQHELQAAAAHRGHQPGEVAHAERGGSEQPDVDHRRATRSSMKQNATSSSSPTAIEPEHPRAGPAGGGVTVGLDAVGDADEQHRQADTEGQRARPVQPPGGADAEFLQRPVAPDGAERCRSARRPRRWPASATRTGSRRSAGPGRIRRRRPPC